MTLSGKFLRSLMILFLCVILLFVGILLLIDTYPGSIICQGKYEGHLQGITTDNNNSIFWSFDTYLVKTDLNGNLLAKSSVPNHHGGLTFYDGKVYVAVNHGKFHKEIGHADSWIYVYDAKQLELISKYSIPEVVYGANGMAYHKNRFFVVGGMHKRYQSNYVYEYNSALKFIKKHNVRSKDTLMGIQTVCFAYGYWWFGCYGKTGESSKLIKTDESFKLLGIYDFDCALGITSFHGDIFLIGRSVSRSYTEARAKALPAKSDQEKGLVILE